MNAFIDPRMSDGLKKLERPLSNNVELMIPKRHDDRNLAAMQSHIGENSDKAKVYVMDSFRKNNSPDREKPNDDGIVILPKEDSNDLVVVRNKNLLKSILMFILKLVLLPSLFILAVGWGALKNEFFSGSARQGFSSGGNEPPVSNTPNKMLWQDQLNQEDSRLHKQADHKHKNIYDDN